VKLLLDMGVAPRTGQFLRQHGHDAIHLWDERLERLLDPSIVTKAAKEGRVIVTFDLDFPRILALERLANPSVILFRLREYTTEDVNDALLDVLRCYGERLERGAIVVIEPDRVRTRTLPLWP
jgi:predicted nuclease of predicted toxin-antitoxin system